MAAPDIAPASRYINVGTSKPYWVPSISNKAAPTRGELNAGTNLAPDNNSSDGWKTTADQVETPDMATRFMSKIPGRINADDSSITMYMDLGGVDARQLMPVDTNGFIVWLDGGDVPGRKMDVFPVRVASHAKTRSTDGKDPATIQIMYAITSQPAENITIP